MRVTGLLRGPRAALAGLLQMVTRLRHHPPAERLALVQLLAIAVGLVVAGDLAGPQAFPPVLQAVPLLLGGLLLRRRAMAVLVAVVTVSLVVEVVQLGLVATRPGALFVVLITGLVAYEFCRVGETTGLPGAAGETFVVELADRLLKQGELPALPRGWNVEAVLSPAGGGPFAGDFVVGSRTGGGRRFEVALVDVSGKGVDAGTRSLLLSGALGGLLGAMRPDRFLSAANSYLERQQWDDGFATAVHVVLDLVDGAFEVDSAGHPPVAHFDAGSGHWSLLTAEGMALGLLPEVHYQAVSGQLDHGDALLLYTDGLVESSGRDLSVGIDRLLGEAERLVQTGFRGGAQRLLDRVAQHADDDRGLVLLWRGA